LLNSNTATVTLTVTGTGGGENEPPRIVTGTMIFTTQIIASNIDETHAVVAADFDGDGDMDAAGTDFVDDTVFWFENDGNFNFTTRVLDSNLDGAYPISIGDVDQDGNVDILACGYNADDIVWYENDGNANFTRRNVDTAANGAHSVVVVDMDKDGDNDLLTTNQDGNSVNWYENGGNENFTLHTIDATASAAKRAEIADIDGDGDWDVFSAAWSFDIIAWHENDGNENFTEHLIDNTVDGAYYVFPVDVDGDGDVDALSASQNDHTIGLYKNDGNGNFTVQAIDTDAQGARSVIAVDIDGDGDFDAVSGSVSDDTVGLYENDGNGNFTEKDPIDGNADGAYGTFAVDMDFDGDVDVLSARRDANNVALHMQTRSHRALLMSQGGTLLIDTSMLETTDVDDGPTELTYTLTDAPDSGDLKIDGTNVPQGGTFTQADIDNNRLTYVHDGSSSFADGFEFTVADGGEGGVMPATGSFIIEIADPSGLARWPLDETSGLVAPDVAGTNDGTLVGGPIWQPGAGRIGGALLFDGANDLVDIGTLDIPAGNGMTVAMWIKPSALSSSPRLISKATGTGEQDHYWMVSLSSATALRFRLKAGGTTSTLITVGNLIVVDEWYHVACTYDQSQMRIYGNGVLITSVPKTGALDTNPAVGAAIGNQPTGAGSDPFPGMIDDVRLYQRALNDVEVAILANATVAIASGPDPRDKDTDGDVIERQPIVDPTALHPNVPNPFNPSTTIRYHLSQSTDVTLQIFDVRGSLVRTLVNRRQAAGGNSVLWNGRDNRGVHVHSGVYFVRLRTPEFEQARKIVLIE
jgi:hypothetical protein